MTTTAGNDNSDDDDDDDGDIIQSRRFNGRRSGQHAQQERRQSIFFAFTIKPRKENIKQGKGSTLSRQGGGIFYRLKRGIRSRFPFHIHEKHGTVIGCRTSKARTGFFV